MFLKYTNGRRFRSVDFMAVFEECKNYMCKYYIFLISISTKTLFFWNYCKQNHFWMLQWHVFWTKWKYLQFQSAYSCILLHTIWYFSILTWHPPKETVVWKCYQWWLYARKNGLLCYMDLRAVFISWFLVHGKPFLTADITLCVLGKIRPSWSVVCNQPCTHKYNKCAGNGTESFS